MNRREKMKLIVFILGMAILTVAMWFVLKHFEKREPKAVKVSTLDEQFLSDPDDDLSEKTLKFNKKKYRYRDDIESYLFIGTDGSGTKAEDGKEAQGAMADFLLLIAFDKTQNSFGCLQLNRDTMTKIRLVDEEGEGEATAKIQLCTAHWYGGTERINCKNTVEAVSHLLGGLKIDGCYSLNMEEIPRLNSIVGGVTVTLEENFTSVDASMKKGTTIKLNNQQAYHYVHDRYGVGDEENTSRMQRQHQYMKAFSNRALELAKQDNSFGAKVYKELQDVSYSTIPGKKITALFDEVASAKSQGILQLEGKTKLGQALGDGIDHTEFYPNKREILEKMTSLYHLEEMK